MKDKKKIIIASAIFISAAVFIVHLYSPKAIYASTVKIEKGKIVHSVTVTGFVEANEKQTFILSSAQKVNKIYVSEGQMIQKGQLLVKLDTADYENQMEKAQIGLDTSRLLFKQLQESASEKNLEAENKAVEQAELKVHTATYNLEKAKQKLERDKTLFDEGAVAKIEYEDTERLLKESDNSLKEAKAQFDVAKLHLNSIIRERRNSMEQQLKNIQSMEAEISGLKMKLNQQNIVSSINGRIVKMNVKEEQFPTSDADTIQIIDVSEYRLKVQLSQFDAVNAVLGQKVDIHVKGVDRSYTGSIQKIGQIAEIKYNGNNRETKVELTITLDNPDTYIKAGYEADVVIVLKQRDNIISLEYEALQTDEAGQKYVFVNQDGKAVKRYVKTGMETDFRIEVLEGLEEGEYYIITTQKELKEGDRIEISRGDNK